MSTATLPPELDYLTADSMGTTAARIVDQLGAKADLLERFTTLAAWPDRSSDWAVVVVPALRNRWVLRWDRTTVAVPSHGDFLLAKAVADARQGARKHLRHVVITAAVDLGLPVSRFARPAQVRCPVCRTNGYGPTHRPGSPDCLETRREADHQRGQ